jgi:hypothetical protein
MLKTAAAASVGYLAYTGYIDMKYSEMIEDNDTFLIYHPIKKHDYSNKISKVSIPVVDASRYDIQKSGFSPEKDKNSAGLSFVKKDDEGIYHSVHMNLGMDFDKWFNFYLNPVKTVSSREDLLNLMKQRKPDDFLKSLILVHVKDKESENLLNKAAIYLYFKESYHKYIPFSLGNYFTLVKVTDEALADELGINKKNIILRILDPRNLLSTKKRRNDYQDPEVIKQYMTEKLNKYFRPCGHEFQLDNQLFFDKFEFDSSEGKFNNWDDLFKNLMSINPSILPIFSPGDLWVNGSKFYQMEKAENCEVLIVSLKQNHKERTIADVQSLIVALKLESFLMKNPEITAIIGYPEYLYKIPIKNLCIYHYEDIEVRLLSIKNGVVVNNSSLEEKMTLEELLNLHREEVHLESSPYKVKQYAEILDIENFNKKILDDTERCAFVMNCSKTCPACVYSEKFFQEAAKLSEKCRFYKYYVSNQNPRFKGPNATPRFHFYRPGDKEPIVYEQKVNGLGVDNFLEFIDKKLAEKS